MNRITLTFGAISGLVAAILMWLTMPFVARFGFDKGLVIGYANILASLLVVHFGVRAYRDNVAGGSISFGKAFWVAIRMGLVSTVFYAASWQVLSMTIMRDFPEKYAAYAIEQAKGKGLTGAALEKETAQIRNDTGKLRNPVFNFLFAASEPLPVLLLVALISAGTVSRGRKPEVAAATPG